MSLSMVTVSLGMGTISCIGKYKNDLLRPLRPEAFDSSPPLELAISTPKRF